MFKMRRRNVLSVQIQKGSSVDDIFLMLRIYISYIGDDVRKSDFAF